MQNINFKAPSREGVVKLIGVDDEMFEVLKDRCRLMADKHPLIVRKMDSLVNILMIKE